MAKEDYSQTGLTVKQAIQSLLDGDLDELFAIATEVANARDGETNLLTKIQALTGNADTDISGNSWVLDEDDMASDSATKVPTQQSTKARITSQTTGKYGLWIPAGAMIARETNGAAPGTVETSVNKVMIQTMDFDNATDEFVQFTVKMPKSWNAGTVTAIFAWSHATTTTNFGVRFFIQGVALSNDDAMDTAFGTAVGHTADTGGTTDKLYSTAETAAVTIGNSPAKEDYTVFQIYRDVSDAGDTLAVDARLHGVMLYITTDAATDV